MFDRPQTLAEAETRIRQTATVEELLGLFAKCAEVMLLDLSPDEFLEGFDKAQKIKSVVENSKAPAYSKLEAYRAYEVLHPDIRREVFPDVLEYDIKKIVSQARDELENSGFLLRGVISDELYELEKDVLIDKANFSEIRLAQNTLGCKIRVSDEEYYSLKLELDNLISWRPGKVYDREAVAVLSERIKKREEQHEKLIRQALDDRLTDSQKDTLANGEKRQKRFDELKKEWLDRVKNNLFEESAVSEEEARRWVEQSVIIPKNLATALTKQGNYPLEEFKADCAEFYRLVGGKIGMVEFGRDGRKSRAFQRGDIEVFMNGEIDKRTLFHELSHVLEANSGFSGPCSKDFVLSRATSDTPQKLNVLCPGSKYENDEIAYPDHFIRAYVGKVYNEENASEVLSMGVERLTSPDLFYDFVTTDAAHCNYILGVCSVKEQFGRKRFEYTDREKADKTANARMKELKKHFDNERRRIGYQTIALKLEQGHYGLIDNHGVARVKGGGYCLYEKDGAEKLRRSPTGNIHLTRLAMYFFAIRDKLEPLQGKSSWAIHEIAVGFHKGKFPAWFTENTTLPSLGL